MFLAAFIVTVIVGLVAIVCSAAASPSRDYRPIPRRQPLPPVQDCCCGVAGGCPVCLAVTLVGAVMIGSWLDWE